MAIADLRTTDTCITGTSGCYGTKLGAHETPANLANSRCPWCREYIQRVRAEVSEARCRLVESQLNAIKAMLGVRL